MSESAPTSLHHVQSSKSEAILDSVTASDAARVRALPEQAQREVQDSAPILNQSPEPINLQRLKKPQKRLYSPEELEDGSIDFDLGKWADLADDHGLDLAGRVLKCLLEMSTLQIMGMPSSKTNPGAGNANMQHRSLELRHRTIWTTISANTTPSLLAAEVRDFIRRNWRTQMKAFGKAARYHLPTVSGTLCEISC